MAQAHLMETSEGHLESGGSVGAEDLLGNGDESGSRNREGLVGTLP